MQHAAPDWLETAVIGIVRLKWEEMVLPRGLNSNRVEQLQVVIKDWVEIYKSPPQLDGKTFQWEPLSIAV